MSKKQIGSFVEESNQGNTLVIDTTGQVERETLLLARELCRDSEYSLCWNGTDTPVRTLPMFIHIDTSSMALSYSKAVYGVHFNHVYDELDKRKIPSDSPIVLYDHFLQYENSNNIVSVPIPKRFKRDFRRSLGEEKHSFIFDGMLKYTLYEMDFDCVYAGKQSIRIYNTDTKYGDFDTFRLCDAYQIIKIHSMKAYEKPIR